MPACTLPHYLVAIWYLAMVPMQEITQEQQGKSSELSVHLVCTTCSITLSCVPSTSILLELFRATRCLIMLGATCCERIAVHIRDQRPLQPHICAEQCHKTRTLAA